MRARAQQGTGPFNGPALLGAPYRSQRHNMRQGRGPFLAPSLAPNLRLRQGRGPAGPPRGYTTLDVRTAPARAIRLPRGPACRRGGEESLCGMQAADRRPSPLFGRRARTARSDVPARRDGVTAGGGGVAGIRSAPHSRTTSPPALRAKTQSAPTVTLPPASTHTPAALPLAWSRIVQAARVGPPPPHTLTPASALPHSSQRSRRPWPLNTCTAQLCPSWILTRHRERAGDGWKTSAGRL